MLAIYAEGQNPHAYGFDFNEGQLTKIARRMRYSEEKMFSALRYRPIQMAMNANCKKEDLPRQIRWFYNADMNNLGRAPVWRKWARIVKRGLEKLIKHS